MVRRWKLGYYEFIPLIHTHISIGKTRVDRMVIHPFSEARTRISCASHMLINRHLGQWALPSFRAQGGASLTELGVISVQHTKTSRNPPIFVQMIFLLGMRDFPLQNKIAGGYRKCWISMNVWFWLKAHQIQGSSIYFTLHLQFLMPVAFCKSSLRGEPSFHATGTSHWTPRRF